MNPKISVIMPSYNRGDVIGESIDSLISQSYKNWELIITDSGSKDNTLEVCKKYDGEVLLCHKNGYLYTKYTIREVKIL